MFTRESLIALIKLPNLDRFTHSEEEKQQLRELIFKFKEEQLLELARDIPHFLRYWHNDPIINADLWRLATLDIDLDEQDLTRIYNVQYETPKQEGDSCWQQDQQLQGALALLVAPEDFDGTYRTVCNFRHEIFLEKTWVKIPGGSLQEPDGNYQWQENNITYHLNFLMRLLLRYIFKINPPANTVQILQLLQACHERLLTAYKPIFDNNPSDFKVNYSTYRQIFEDPSIPMPLRINVIRGKAYNCCTFFLPKEATKKLDRPDIDALLVNKSRKRKDEEKSSKGKKLRGGDKAKGKRKSSESDELFEQEDQSDSSNGKGEFQTLTFS